MTTVDELTETHWEELSEALGKTWRDYYRAYCVTIGDPDGFKRGLYKFCRPGMHNHRSFAMYFGPHKNGGILIGYAGARGGALDKETPQKFLDHIETMNLQERDEIYAPTRFHRTFYTTQAIQNFIKLRRPEGIIFSQKLHTSSETNGKEESRLYTFFR